MELEQFKCEVCERKKRWIPVSEKLPRVGQKCLVTYCDQEDSVKWVAVSEYSGDDFYWKYVIAWMPMPEAYEEDKNEKNE